MTTKRIIEVILATPALRGKLIWLAAVAAEAGSPDGIADVQAFWRRQGGTVCDENPPN